MIRLTIPSIEQEDLEAVREVVASGYLVQAGRVEAFERSVAAYVGTAHAVAVANCTAALHLSLLALDIRPGDRVAVPTYSWPATANVVALCGAEPVFIDISPDTYGMDPGALEDALRRKAVKAILPVHAFGGMADVNAIGQIATRAGVPVIEDAACALGAALNGANAGTWGVAGCFSFHPRKAITTGEGGMVTTSSSARDGRIRSLRDHGASRSDFARHTSADGFLLPEYEILGFNYRMTDIQGALGSAQMDRAA